MKSRVVDAALLPFLDALAELLVADHMRGEAQQAPQPCVSRTESETGGGTPAGSPKRPYGRLKRPEMAISNTGNA